MHGVCSDAWLVSVYIGYEENIYLMPGSSVTCAVVLGKDSI
jgi:hypothetical protein